MDLDPEFDAPEEEEFDDVIRLRTRDRRREQRMRKHAPPAAHEQFVQQADDTQKTFDPTFTPSKHERAWMIAYLGRFYEEYLITDILRSVRGGKEANVYLCRGHTLSGENLIAAKVYRPRMFRSLRNDAVYRLGRELVDEAGKEARDRRTKLAVKKRTDFGQEVMHNNWLANEYGTLRVLHAAGADVPRPIASAENAMLMAYLGDEQAPAPMLNRVKLAPDEARRVFDRLMHNVQLMLAHHCVHADLSAYNVLYWQGGIKLIDFPQAADPRVNPQALVFLERDLRRLGDYFQPYGIRMNAREMALELWRRYV